MNQQKRIKILRDWAAGKYRPPAPAAETIEMSCPPVVPVNKVFKPHGGTAPIALSFCTGAMGLDLGLERAGFEVILASETDPDARATIATNRPGLPILGDLRDYAAAEVRAAAGIDEDTDIDLVAAGVPCQTYSSAGGLRGTADERGMVLVRFVYLATSLAPRYVVIENVPGLASKRHIHVLEHVLRMLRDGDYSASWKVYDAVDFGAAQRRKRVIIIASRRGRVPSVVPTHHRHRDGLSAWRTLKDAIGDMSDIEHHYARYTEKRLRFFRQLKPGQNWRHLPHPEKALSEATIAATGGKAGYYRRLAWDKPAPTLLTSPTNFLGGCCHPDEDRPLSVEEYKRLQGFPDDLTVCGDLQSQYRQLGNAVPVPLGEAIGKTIIEHRRTEWSKSPVHGPKQEEKT